MHRRCDADRSRDRVGARIEADFAQRARDLREKAAERDAIARARIHAQRLRAAAEDGGPVERAWQAVGAAELSRARGRPDPALWTKAAAEWEGISRPFLAALARWRAAEAYVEVDDRAAATLTARDALDVARRVGSGWLTQELTLLGERARLDLIPAARARVRDDRAADRATAAAPPRASAAVAAGAGADPFGLTPRERQVLALIAEGATNRQIGAALFMAEKTASVHVSRILSKLGVRSRTQAAAVAHRLDLTGVGR